VIRRIFHVGLFLAGLLGTAAAIRTADVVPFFSWTRQTIVHLQSKVADVDTLFVGSSRFQYGIRPELFDARMAELGTPTKSFNAALSGLRQVDHDEVVEWILAHRSPALKRVVIELHTWRQYIRGGSWFTDQEVELHTQRSFLPRMQAVLTDHQGPWRKLQEAAFVTAHALTNTLCIGQAGRILAERLMVGRGEPLPKVYPVPAGGWCDIADNPSPPMVKEHDDFERDRATFDRSLGSKIDDLTPPWLVGPTGRNLLRAQAHRLRAAGIEPIYVIMPTWLNDFPNRGEVAACRQDARILELDVVADETGLYARENWYDASHFNAKGASVFSPRLAERLVECLAQPAGAAPAAKPVAPAPIQLRATFDASKGCFELHAECATLHGRILAVASSAVGEHDFGGGVTAGVAWPPNWSVPMDRTGIGPAVVTIPGTAVRADAPACFQAFLLDGERHVAASAVVTVAPRR
jgi:hypothetical protein